MAKNTTNLRQNRILNLVKDSTLSTLDQPGAAESWIHAGIISELLHMDRANVSRELNNLHKAGVLIKMQGKPTLYIYRSYLTKKYPVVFFPSTIPKGLTLSDYTVNVGGEASKLISETVLTELETQVGVNGTMKSAVMHAKAALMYPPHGLHTLITGNVGVGKSRFIQKMYDHAVKTGCMEADAPFISFNCRDYAISSDAAMGQIFGMGSEATPKGERGKRGLLERASGGIFCIIEIEKLPTSVQDSLISLLEKNTFTRMGEASIVRYASTMIIAVSTEAPDSDALKPFRQRFPTQIHIPDLDDRLLSERMEILLLMFQEESFATGLTFKIKKDVLTCFLQASYRDNLGEMMSTVRIACSLMYFEFSSMIPRSKSPEINFRNLPENLLRAIRDEPRQEYRINELLDSLALEYITFSPGSITTNRLTGAQLFDMLHSGTSEHALLAGSPASASGIVGNIQTYFSSMWLKYAANSEEETWMKEFDDVVCAQLQFHSELSFIIENKTAKRRLLRCIHDAARKQLSLVLNAKVIAEFLSRRCADAYRAARNIFSEVNLRKDILTDSDLVYLTICIDLLKSRHAAGSLPILAVFHGNGVGEGMAGYVNSALSANVVYGLSYLPDMTIEELMTQVKAAVAKIDSEAGILVATDISPLPDICDFLRNLGIRSECVTDVSLKTLLLLSKKSLEEEPPLDALAKSADISPVKNIAVNNTASFINRTVNEVLAPSLTFLNPQKAIEVLLGTLDRILDELKMPPSVDITIKFIFHCSHMLERLIRGNKLKYDKLKMFVNEHGELMSVLEQCMEYTAEVFGILIPASELAYVAEIFIVAE